MAPKRSEERYNKGGKVVYLTYVSPQRLSKGKTQPRTRMQRLYFPGDVRNIRVGKPGEVAKRTGRKVHGVAIEYDYVLKGARARRGNTRYELPERQSKRTKIVDLPDNARNIRLTDNPPKGPTMAVA
jgi:hypothetical protein